MRKVLIGLLLLIAMAVAGLVGVYACYTCTLPPVGALTPLPPPSIQPGAPKNADGSPNWQARTLIDLAAIRQQIWDNTPVPYDTENPQYKRWLNAGFAEAEARAASVRDYAGYFYTLAAYVNGFRDPHFQLSLMGDAPPARWPGFIAARTGDAAEIAFRDEKDPAAPQVGTKIVACDGKPVAQLLDERIFPFRLNPMLASDRRAAMSRLFLDRANPFAPAPTTCRAEYRGRTFDIALAWRAAPPSDDEWWQKFQAASSGMETEWGVREAAPGVYWIGVPTFSSGDSTGPRLDALIQEVEAKAAAMRQARAIVIDTRGNGGGNSSWADKLAAAIFTGDVLARHKVPDRQEAVDWRGSRANAAFWSSWASTMAKEFGPFSFNSLGAMFLRWQLGRSAAQDPPIWRLGSCKTEPAGGLTKQRPRGASPFPARVYLLSNGSCGSSCLSFADTVLMVPGVKLIGSATSGDGAYMEVRSELLPSMLAQITFPQKVSRGAGRAHLEAYEPDISYEGLWSNEAVTAWTLAQVAEGK